MSPSDRPIVIATRGSALALAQAKLVLNACRAAFPDLRFEIKTFKTTGDNLQKLPANTPNPPALKGLFTKELEIALLNHEADLAVHSLKDLPTELSEGLTLGAVTKREDARDVLIYRDAASPIRSPQSAIPTPGATSELRGLKPRATLRDFPAGAMIATSSTRRQAQLLAVRSDLKLVPIRGNVGTRLRKLAEQAELDGLVLAAAGLNRLHVRISPDGKLSADDNSRTSTAVPRGLLASYLTLEEMLPCVGQGAIGIETRANDKRVAALCDGLNDRETCACVTAERAFLRALGGGCLSPVAAYGAIVGDNICLRAVSFQDGKTRKGEMSGPLENGSALGAQLAAKLKS